MDENNSTPARAKHIWRLCLATWRLLTEGCQWTRRDFFLGFRCTDVTRMEAKDDLLELACWVWYVDRSQMGIRKSCG